MNLLFILTPPVLIAGYVESISPVLIANLFFAITEIHNLKIPEEILNHISVEKPIRVSLN